MSILWTNNASTTIAGSITPSSTTVNLAGGSGLSFPQPTGGDYYVATFYDQATKTNYEIVHVTAMSGDVATITRAQEGTLAKNWTAGDIFANLVTAGTLNMFALKGTGPSDTSQVHVGTDTSVTTNLIVATTNPVPSAFADGMLFNILVKNTNTGPMNPANGGGGLQLNGLAPQGIFRTDGSDMVGGNLIAGQEAMFIFKGGGFNSTVPPIPQQPPAGQTNFYVDGTYGNDNNSGLGPTTSAFLTIQGAINQIKSRYIAANGVTINVANGTYTEGFGDSTNFIAFWNIQGNSANPANVVINATSTSGSAYPNGAPPGRGVVSSGKAMIHAEGFTFQTALENAASTESGYLSIKNCNFTPSTMGLATPIAAYGNSYTFVTGVCQFTSYGTSNQLFAGAQAGMVMLGYQDPFSDVPLVFSIQGSPTFTYGTALATQNGVIWIQPANTSFTGVVPTGPKYWVGDGGGIIQPSPLPGTQPGNVYSPGWLG